MKINKSILILGISVLLFSGQSTAIAAQSAGNDTVTLNGTEATDVFFTFVGTSSVDSGALTPTAGTYDLVGTDVLLTFKANVSGTETRAVAGTDVESNGQLMLINNGEVVDMGPSIASTGIPLLFGVGDHTVTLLYVNQAEDQSFTYSSDTVIIRVRADAADFGTYATASGTLTFSVSDSASAAVWGESAFIYNDGGLTKAFDARPASAITVTDSIGVVADGEQLYLGDGVTIGGTVDSTGRWGFATDANGYSTVGRTFIVDAAGVTLASTATTVTLHAAQSDGTQTVSNVGVLTLSDGGLYFHEGTDLEGWGSVNGTDTDASAEFGYTLDTIRVRHQPTAPSLNTIVSTTTNEAETEFSGISALLGLFAIGTIAYTIPRRFKK